MFQLLGPVEVWDGDRKIALHGTKPTTFLAALLLAGNCPVSDETMRTLLWGSSPPTTSTAQIHTYASRLRAAIAPIATIHRYPQGYQLELSGNEILDLNQFRLLSDEGQDALELGDPERAFTRLAEALSLWRGTALDGVTAHLAHLEGPRLEQLRIAAIKTRAQAERALAFRVDSSPSHTSRDRLTLTEPTYLDAEPAYPAAEPTYLAAEPPEFVGRNVVTATAGAELRAAAWPSPVAELGRPPRTAGASVIGLVGMAGIGKTAMALHLARQLREVFPDGQIRADLGGTTDQPAGTAQILSDLLTGLGVPEHALSSDIPTLRRMYRQRLRGRRILILLDDATDERQVRPLLPDGHGSGVIITSRSRLAVLEGLHRVELDGLEPGEAMTLLGRLIGPDRLTAQPRAATQLLRSIGHLPLAIRICAARLVARPHWPLTRLAGRLGDPGKVLDELRLTDLDVRESIGRSYRTLRPHARKAFRLLSIPDRSTRSLGTAAAVLDEPAEVAEGMLIDLAGVHLLRLSSADDAMYTFHPLVHAFARERLWEEESREEWSNAARRASAATTSTPYLDAV